MNKLKVNDSLELSRIRETEEYTICGASLPPSSLVRFSSPLCLFRPFYLLPALMKTFAVSMLAILALLAPFALSAIEPDMKTADKLNSEGNYKEAYELYAKIAVSKRFPAKQSARALEMATAELRRLNKVKNIDPLIEKTVKSRSDDRPVLFAAAKLKMSVEHFGYLIGGDFQRGWHRGGGKMVNSYSRDRVKALRLFKRSAELAMSSGASPTEHYAILNRFAAVILYDRGYNEAWRLQILTNLEKLPELEKNTGMYYFRGRNSSGAPVNLDGSPVFFKLPKSFESAKNDGERWRFLIDEAAKVYPKRKMEQLAKFAGFLQTQFGVQTMAFNYFNRRGRGTAAKPVKDGPYSVHTLSDDETIAKLATGFKRFKLPNEYNYIKIYREIANSNNASQAKRALEVLANILTNRRQYDKGAGIWREVIRRFGPGRNGRYKKLLNQIVGNWGNFEPAATQTPTNGGKLLFRYRNAAKAIFTAKQIDISALIRDIEKYMESNPLKFDRRKSQIASAGYELVNGNRAKYLGAKVAEWTKKLSPDKNHFDKIAEVNVPIKKAGAYLITVKLADGNSSNIVLWLDNAAIVRKRLDGAELFFVADAETGAPLPNAKLEFFGYKTKYVGRKLSNAFLRRNNILTKRASVKTNSNGISIVGSYTLPANYNWLISAKSADGSKTAWLGFQRIWFGKAGRIRNYDRVKTFLITDRPVYRPKQTMKFKFWVRKASYALGDEASTFAGRAFNIEIRNPRGEKILAETLTADKFGGVSGELKLPADATLGNYRIFIKHYGGGVFRVEEYRKPEFEVVIEAPKEPVSLGDTITAVIKAKYYFGAPVTNAKVKYKVLRTPRNTQWFPPAPWDWLYGSGYWWFGCKRTWYPGWNSWGCLPPRPWWFRAPTPQPELVMENEVPIGPDGTVRIKIDSTVAKALFGKVDQNYAITAKVVDASRRMVSGAGSVIAAVKPFNVTVWLDRGYLQVGHTATARFAARGVLGGPVTGKSVLKLFKINYDSKGKPSETLINTWNRNISYEGACSQKFTADAAGQYRLSCVVTDAKFRSIEGGYLFTVRGAGKEWSAGGKNFRFNDLELVNDKRKYAPGEKPRLMISTKRENSCVLLFPRVRNGLCPKPEILRLKGKTAFAEIAIGKIDMPNFFVEALTVSDGKVHTIVREIVVPPEKRVLNVEIIPNHPKTAIYKPGAKAKLKIKITDIFGKPVPSSVVLTLYDKSVEQISGGSNVPDIKSFFWKWRRSYSSQTMSSLNRGSANITKRKAETMRQLGLFGVITADAEQNLACDSISCKSNGGRRRGRMLMCTSKSAEMKHEGMAMPSAAPRKEKAGGGGAVKPAKIAVRANFADTAYWNASITPDSDGIAEIEV
ncbi:MAG: hypothetical protein KAG97_02800, partial [Victivallales bacterium]|nr:hypothetical protein [Victivallales bacterium]